MFKNQNIDIFLFFFLKVTYKIKVKFGWWWFWTNTALLFEVRLGKFYYFDIKISLLGFVFVLWEFIFPASSDYEHE